MKRPLQASDNSSSARPRLELPPPAGMQVAQAGRQAPNIVARKPDGEFNLLHQHRLCFHVENGANGRISSWSALALVSSIDRSDPVSGLTPLMLAIKKRKPDTVRLLLEKGAKPDQLCQRGITALMYAAARGDADMIELLITNGAVLGQVDEGGQTALHHAVSRGQVATAALLLDRGMDIDLADCQGNTALHIAMIRNRLELASLLLERRAAVDRKNKSGDTALTLAATLGGRDMIDLLLEQRHFNEFAEWSWMRSVTAAARYGRQDILELLLGAVARQSTIKELFNTDSSLVQLDQAHVGALMGAVAGGQIQVIAWLLAQGVNIDVADSSGCTALIVAVRSRSLATLQYLLDNGANARHSDNLGLSLLHYAAGCNAVDIAECLHRRGLAINVQDGSGQSPLMVACQKGYRDLAQYLLSHGADVGLSNANELQAIHFAATHNHPGMAALLLGHGASVEAKARRGMTPLMCAATAGSQAALAFLLDGKAVVSAVDDAGRSALHYAATYATANSAETIGLLCRHGADVRLQDKNGTSPLLAALAEKEDRPDAVRALLDHGADPAQVDAKGWNAFHISAHNGHKASLALLLERQRHAVDIPSEWGVTALMLAAIWNHPQAVELLLQYRANTFLLNKDNNSALDRACELGHAEVVNILLREYPISPNTANGTTTALNAALSKALSKAIAGRHAGVIEVLLRHEGSLVSAAAVNPADPVILDLLAFRELLARNSRPGLASLADYKRFFLAPSSLAALNEFHEVLFDNTSMSWSIALRKMNACNVVVHMLQTATNKFPQLRTALVGTVYQITPMQKTQICAAILASPQAELQRASPYADRGLSRQAAERFQALAEAHADMLATAAGQAQAPLRAAIDNLHDTCLRAVSGKFFDQLDLYRILTAEYGLYEIPAKRISAAFSDTWKDHAPSSNATRAQALARELQRRANDPEVLAPIRAASETAGNEESFHLLLNGQLELIADWCRKILEPAAQ